jgi:hypothetical protein
MDDYDVTPKNYGRYGEKTAGSNSLAADASKRAVIDDLAAKSAYRQSIHSVAKFGSFVF